MTGGLEGRGEIRSSGSDGRYATPTGSPSSARPAASSPMRSSPPSSESACGGRPTSPGGWWSGRSRPTGVLEGRKVCRIRSNKIYRALGFHPGLGRTEVGTESTVVRLLSLDYLLERPRLPWLPTAAEKVGAFEAAGIARELLPSRLSGGPQPGRVLYFPSGLPVAFDGGRALFAYADPGYTMTRPFREWAGRHRRLWEALRERGHPVEVVAIVRAVREFRRSRRALGVCRAPDPSPTSGKVRAVRRERERIERGDHRGERRCAPGAGRHPVGTQADRGAAGDRARA